VTVIEVISLRKHESIARSPHPIALNSFIMSIVHDTAPPAKAGLSDPTPITTSEDKPFPFLALPKELRLMVYERIPIRISHDICDVRYPENSMQRMIFVVACTTVGILATSRQIQNEAAEIMSKKLATMLGGPLRLMIDIADAEHVRCLLLDIVSDVHFYLESVEDLIRQIARELNDSDEVESANPKGVELADIEEAEWNDIDSSSEDETCNDPDEVSNTIDQIKFYQRGIMSYPCKWFTHLEKTTLLSAVYAATPQVKVKMEAGISHDQGDAFTEDQVCSTLRDFTRGFSGLPRVILSNSQVMHRLIRNSVPTGVFAQLPDYHSTRPSQTPDNIGDAIENLEYANEWYTKDGIHFSSSRPFDGLYPFSD
jgi:hypothetical protein